MRSPLTIRRRCAADSLLTPARRPIVESFLLPSRAIRARAAFPLPTVSLLVF
jgi:hypothetical protein